MLVMELSRLRGVSGDEGAVRAYIKNLAEPHADEIRTDGIGNLIVVKYGKTMPDKKLMLAAHMDEVGMIAADILESGQIAFMTVGGIDERILVSKRVRIGSAGIPGVIGAKAVHLQTKEEQTQPIAVNRLTIDIGAASRQEAEKLVKTGDYITFDSDPALFGNRMLKGKALDDRAGCALALEALKTPCPWTLVVAFTVQEEIGLRGARVAARRVAPDAAIVLEGTAALDMVGVERPYYSTRLGAGPALSLIDRSAIHDGALRAFVQSVAQRESIAWQYREGAFGGTDSGAIQQANCGVRALTVSVPCRYIHSPVCVMSLDDYEMGVRLLSSVVKNIGQFEG